ncbi:DUF771 domain-containing protein [Streptococcus suis]|uniref:Uncharacterized protein conserved in bacteria n=1 Tax=Streptococcus suis TaxID=1307 RepID=A0AB33UA18_STRSU|nr:DUF771 domain-containing protein [Streptococcus suis]MCK3866919.1 DUF771 domain-containing protein [Streptococcus suis]NQH21487.1 DUF771 domain-containing protein [Streptococcus suis]NQH54487.1 DUF771 domain-containing protein [Streptococcus suis]NQI88794.1 DUF771 domain-containing protein [Streptococcus suis]NQI92014.1 DUF771 domain-containing protein [Streptococcus suis]
MTKFQIDLTNLTIELPESKIIVDRNEYEQLKQTASQGRYMTLSEVLELLSVSRPWLLENVLYKPTIRKQIDIDQNKDGFVKYPQNQGGRYYFLASKTRNFFERNFLEIFK